MPTFRARGLLLLALAAAPVAAAAAPAYVPLLNPLANDGSTSVTEVWLANPATTQAAFTPGVNDIDSDGSQPPTTGSMAILGGHSVQLTGLAQNGKYGLLDLQLGTGITVDARITTTSPDGHQVVSRVPVI